VTGTSTSNVSETGLDQMSDAIAHSTLTYAMTGSSINGTSKALDTAAANFAPELKGGLRVR
jgi:hypothetical protein